MKKKNVFRSMLSVALSICMVCVLSACGSKTQEKSESQISEDVQAQDDYLNTYDLKLDSFSITKRQTNEEEKNDLVWCEISASNDIFSYSAEYKLTYVLYNDGWLLEECNRSSSTATPLSPPPQTQEEAMALVMANWEQGDLSNVSQSRISASSSLQEISDLEYAYYFRVSWKTRLGLDGIPVDYAVYYRFDFASGWYSEVDDSVRITWH